MPTPPPLPSIPEDQATGKIAALYADLRAVTGLPVVNLIWRHLATLPGALPWCWGVLRPLYAGGAVNTAAERLLAGLRLPPPERIPPISAEALAVAGVPPEALPPIRRVLDTYHRANPLNLVALGALLARLEGRDSGGTPLPASRRPEAGPQDALPPMLDVESLPPPLAGVCWRLAALGVDGQPGEMPSVWRNLANYPGYLALALTVLRPLEADGWLAREMDGLRIRRDALCGDLLASGAGEPNGDAPAGEVGMALQTALRRFTGGLIVRMVPLVAVLRETLPVER